MDSEQNNPDQNIKKSSFATVATIVLVLLEIIGAAFTSAIAFTFEILAAILATLFGNLS